ncbi:uncharacterized protein VTP21DRAFT_11330 [Calcarisporiella thermophila]|uniref:uncharacterized protein n=1 Tax=Calcarisporiella thermophila TaxID=911321 RepID=UPI0037431EF8
MIGFPISALPFNSISSTMDPVDTTKIFREDLFKGKVALVSGGGTGICKGMATALARHGAKLAIISRKLNKLEEAAEDIRKQTGTEVLALAADVRKPADLEAAVQKTIEKFKRIDILVNGAAGNFLATIDDLSYNAFRTVIEIDLLGTFNLTKAALPYLRQTRGSIINVSATLGYNGTIMVSHAGAAKAAIDTFTKHMAVELGPSGIRVNCIAPGPIADTEGYSRLMPEGMLQRAKQLIPLQRFGTIRDIEQATVFLASDASCWTTGAVLVVDGGHWLTGNSQMEVYPDIVLRESKSKL